MVIKAVLQGYATGVLEKRLRCYMLLHMFMSETLETYSSAYKAVYAGKIFMFPLNLCHIPSAI